MIRIEIPDYSRQRCTHFTLYQRTDLQQIKPNEPCVIACDSTAGSVHTHASVAAKNLIPEHHFYH
ncbi:hypothetical protein [Nitrosomonas sp. PY1]|uniref:hypothetical protein n=1 Tax=Nitrosomonas sp. PY1 TaxID=1803906 RepID=UPI001FC83898|nr:hypothetical protein [Nitrosomonas sp. PY1]